MGKTILVGSAIAFLGVFVFLFLLSPIFIGFGYGGMMGGRNSSQTWNCPAFDGNGGRSGNTGWGMMGNWR